MLKRGVSSELSKSRKRQDSGYLSSLSDEPFVPDYQLYTDTSARSTNIEDPLREKTFLDLLRDDNYYLENDNSAIPPLFNDATLDFMDPNSFGSPPWSDEVDNNYEFECTTTKDASPNLETAGDTDCLVLPHDWNDGGNGEPGETMSWCKLTADNIEHVLGRFMVGVHMIQRFKVKYGQNQHYFITVDGLTYDELKNLLDEHETIELSKLCLDKKKMLRFAGIDLERKRSIAGCQSVLRGLALEEKWSEISEMLTVKDPKAKNNRFTNFQRNDRSNGVKLERAFVKKNTLSSACCGYSEMEEQLNVTIVVFNYGGYVDYVSPKFCQKVVYFYQGCEPLNKIFLVKNIKGFCRID